MRVKRGRRLLRKSRRQPLEALTVHLESMFPLCYQLPFLKIVLVTIVKNGKMLPFPILPQYKLLPGMLLYVEFIYMGDHLASVFNPAWRDRYIDTYVGGVEMIFRHTLAMSKEKW